MNWLPQKDYAARRLLVAIAALLAVLSAACSSREPDVGPDPEAETPEKDARLAQPGRWREFRTHRFDPDLSAEQRQTIEELEALGYLSGSREGDADGGVRAYDADRAYEGLNFFTSGHAPKAILMDMHGRVLHTWSYDFWRVWPDYPVEPNHPSIGYWRRAQLLENGDVLAIFGGLGIIKVDKDSNLIWANPGKAHHDLEVRPNGDIYVLTREAKLVPRINEKAPILEDYISILDPDGKEKRRISILECFENSDFRHLLAKSNLKRRDIFHTNTVSVLDGRIAGRAPGFQKGNVLTSMANFNSTIAVIDLEEEKVVWAHRGDFRLQHDPKILENGNLLLFDNQPGEEMRSNVTEFDPVSLEVKWRYEGSAEAPFYTETCGTVDRLPNGNTLITESDNGRVFEVMADGTVVWEYYNPHRAGDDGQFIATLFEMVRLEPDFPLDWLATD